MVQVVTLTEQARGCGYRKPSKSGVGIYLIGPAFSAPCGRLPIPLHVCPVCSAGIKRARGWTWIEPTQLFGPLLQPQPAALNTLDSERAWVNEWNKLGVRPCAAGTAACSSCPIGLMPVEGRHGLLWIGEEHYRSHHLFMLEASKMGISRKLGALPNGFELGKTWVFLAHRKAVPRIEMGVSAQFDPGVFTAFKPTGVDLVIADEHNVPERAVKLAEELGSGARIVKVVRDVDTQRDLFEQRAP